MTTRHALLTGSGTKGRRTGRSDRDELLSLHLAERAMANPATLHPSDLVRLQRSIGNRGSALAVQRDSYAYGAANVTPHIHVYSGGDCHLKDSNGTRFNLVQGGQRVKQARINEAFDAIRQQFPNPSNPKRIAVLAALRDLLRGRPRGKSET